VNDLADVIKHLRDTHAQMCFTDAADALAPVASHHYLIAVSLIQQALQHTRLADLAQTRELASGRA
jgi:hypothetical protein